jgi:hypothetical protein
LDGLEKEIEVPLQGQSFKDIVAAVNGLLAQLDQVKKFFENSDPFVESFSICSIQ